MPVSVKQLAWAHTAEGRAQLGDAKLHQWEQEAKGVKLPERSAGPAASKKVEARLNK